eukprot:m.122708 g.122708  ORF g.122708 m.122708 type:complete len:469 (+) comp12941_c0_seq10:28-1434(+)
MLIQRLLKQQRKVTATVSHVQQLHVVSRALSRVSSFEDAKRRYEHVNEIGNFSVVGRKAVPEFEMLSLELEHKHTGAKVFHLARADDNNTFAVGFPTIPSDSSGVPHILEHTVLCGSERYPCRDPFFKMLNRSLSNFMNAMTASDFTVYPFSTTNAQDYKNLMNVYTDAVFFPKLSEFDFLQEGWRLENEDVTNKDSPIVFKGVVYNEMKGAFSSIDMLFLQRGQQLLHTNTTYSHVSGGEPNDIPSLTWENLKKFHSKFYNFSNARFLTYGDLPLEETLQQIEKSALNRTKSTFTSSATKEDTEPVVGDVWPSPRRARISCVFDPNESSKQTSMSVKFLLHQSLDSYTRFCWNILETLLLSTEASPFYKALIDSKLAPSFSADTGFDQSTAVPVMSFGVKGIDESDCEHVKDVILNTLKTFASEPVDENRVSSILHQMKLSQHVIPSDFGLRALKYHVNMESYRFSF